MGFNMKKINLSLILAILLIAVLCSCSATSVVDKNNHTTTTEGVDDHATTTTEAFEAVDSPVSIDEEQDPFTLAGMPIPFENFGGDGNRHFTQRYKINSCGTMITHREFLEYLDMEENDFISQRDEKFPGGFWESVKKTSVDEFNGIFYTILEYNIPDEVIVRAIEKNNDFYKDIGGAEGDIFSDEDIEALLSRDFEKITAQFAESTAIIIAENAYSPFWLYTNTPDAYKSAGITTDMISEKLELYSEFNFTAEATEAFENKLSAFMGEEITLDRTARSDNLS